MQRVVIRRLGLLILLATLGCQRLWVPFSRPPKKNVVVVGGGFAGLAVCRRLRRRFNVTLVDAKQYFEFVPGMVRPYSNPDLHRKLVLDYAKVCSKMKVAWTWARCAKIRAGEVLVQPAKGADLRPLPYDFCVVAAGCDHGDLWTISPSANATRGADPKCLEGRQQQIEEEYRNLKELDERGAHVAVIGAGFVGVEFAAELRYFFPSLEISVVSSSEGCVPSMPKGAQDYIQRYFDQHNITTYYKTTYSESESAGIRKAFWSGLGRAVPARVFKSVGMAAQCDFLPKSCLTEKGYVKLMRSLQIANGSQDDAVPFADGQIFAIGSCAGQVPGIDPLPKNSFPAEEMAAHAARNILRGAKGKSLKPFRKWPWMAGVSATSLGPKDGVLLVNSNARPQSGFVALRGRMVVWIKELIRWTKVDECRLGILGTSVWRFVH